MDSAKLMRVLPSTIMMFFWLVLVGYTAYKLFKRSRELEGNDKKSLNFLFEGFVIIFIGDLLHTIGFDISVINGDPAGTINFFGGIMQVRLFALFFDGLAFIVFYMMWAFFIVYRYQDGEFKTYDKIVVTLSLLAFFFMLSSPYIESSIIYYEVAWFGPHMILFVLFGGMTVYKLLMESNKRRKGEGEDAREEKHLFFTAWGFVFSFVFFILTIVLLPIDSSFGMFMIPKTFAYAFALGALIRGLLWKKQV